MSSKEEEKIYAREASMKYLGLALMGEALAMGMAARRYFP